MWVVVWFGKSTDIALLVSLFGFTIPAYIDISRDFAFALCIFSVLHVEVALAYASAYACTTNTGRHGC